MLKAKRMIKYYEAGSELFSCETIEPPPYIRSTENPINFYEPEEKEYQELNIKL